MNPIRHLILLCLLCLACAGCVPLFITAGATAGIVYAAGDLSSDEPYSIDTLWVASMDTIHSLQMTPVTRQKDEVRARLLARGAERSHVYIRLERITDSDTHVKIRVGTFGDEAMSRFLLDRIRQFARR